MSARLLDLYCCQGGAGEGYRLAGFDVTGVDIDPQPRNPHRFIQADAIEYLREHGHEYDVIHASPPCQRWTRAQKIRGREHPDLIAPTRDVLLDLGLPYVIENVEEARPALLDPVMLCGAAFGLRTYRHRLFETNWGLMEPEHPDHQSRTTKMGRPPVEGEFVHLVGNFSGVALAREVMGMPWANRDGLREAIPPVYTELIGRELMAYMERRTGGMKNIETPDFGDEADVVRERDGLREYVAHRCWKCPNPAAWHVTDAASGETMWSCADHRAEAFS